MSLLAVHRALWLQPWQQRRGSRHWPWVAATPLLLALPALAVAALGRISTGALIEALCLVWLTWLWWMQADGLLRQNRPALARLVPGHAAALRLSLVAQGMLVTAAVVALLALAVDGSLRWVWLVAPMVVTLAWLAREPWLWLAFGIASPMLGSLRAFMQFMSALPLAAQALALASLAVLLGLCVGQGGRLHRSADARERRWNRSAAAVSEGRPTPAGQHGPLLRALQRLFDWPLRLWRHRVLAAGSEAPVAVRLDLGLDSGGRWSQQLWVALLILAATVALVTAIAPRHDLSTLQLIDAGRFGLGIGLYAAIAGTLHTRLGQLWARRREQALLVLLPGAPLGGEVAALERRWRREWLLTWGAATSLVLSIGAFGSPGTLDFLAACAAVNLSLGWVAQRMQRRLRATPRLSALGIVPLAAAVLAYAAQQSGVPAWVSLGLGLLVYVAAARPLGRGGLQLPVGRAG